MGQGHPLSPNFPSTSVFQQPTTVNWIELLSLPSRRFCWFSFLGLIWQLLDYYLVYMEHLSLLHHKHRPPIFKLLKLARLLFGDLLLFLAPQIYVYDGHLGGEQLFHSKSFLLTICFLYYITAQTFHRSVGITPHAYKYTNAIYAHMNKHALICLTAYRYISIGYIYTHAHTHNYIHSPPYAYTHVNTPAEICLTLYIYIYIY